MSEFKCANCEFCGREVEAHLMCTIILTDENKEEKACWCVCKDCEQNFRENIKDYYRAMLEDMKKKQQ